MVGLTIDLISDRGCVMGLMNAGRLEGPLQKETVIKVGYDERSGLQECMIDAIRIAGQGLYDLVFSEIGRACDAPGIERSVMHFEFYRRREQ